VHCCDRTMKVSERGKKDTGWAISYKIKPRNIVPRKDASRVPCGTVCQLVENNYGGNECSPSSEYKGAEGVITGRCDIELYRPGAGGRLRVHYKLAGRGTTTRDARGSSVAPAYGSSSTLH